TQGREVRRFPGPKSDRGTSVVRSSTSNEGAEELEEHSDLGRHVLRRWVDREDAVLWQPVARQQLDDPTGCARLRHHPLRQDGGTSICEDKREERRGTIGLHPARKLDRNGPPPVAVRRPVKRPVEAGVRYPVQASQFRWSLRSTAPGEVARRRDGDQSISRESQ